MIKWYKDADTGELMPLPDETIAKQHMPQYLESMPVNVTDTSNANAIILDLKTQLEEERKLRIILENEKPSEKIKENVNINKVKAVMTEPKKYIENRLSKKDNSHFHIVELQNQIYAQKIKALQILDDSSWIKF